MSGPWMRSIVTGAIGGILDAVAAEVIDHRSFNLSKSGVLHIVDIALVGAVIALVAYWAHRFIPDKRS